MGTPHLIKTSFYPRIREISENSSGQISNGFGSCTTTEHPLTEGFALGSGMPGKMGSSGIHYTNYPLNHSSQSSMGGSINGPLRGPGGHYIHMPPKGRMGRRVSDGGPYVAAYKMFMEKRSPQLTQIRSNTNIEKSDSSSVSSVKLLLQEKVSYGGLPNTTREWQQFKNQVREGGREGGEKIINL